MKQLIPILIFAIQLSISQASFAQQEHLYPGYSSGKCYAKCIVAGAYETSSIALPIYIGEDDSIELETIEIIIQQEHNKWEKNPETGTWKLHQQEQIIEEFEFLKDTTKTKDFYLEYVDVKNILSPPGTKEWKEVVCEKDVTPELISELQYRLEEEGFTENWIDGEFCKKTEAALVKFQKANDLLFGYIDLETLQVLGIGD